MADESRPSKASAARWSLYLRCLEGWDRDGLKTVASRQLAESLGLRDAQVRRDLAWLGNLGRSGVGYRIPELVAGLRRAMGLDRPWTAVLVGAGNLARALLRYRGFPERGFSITALFDSDATKVGKAIEGVPVFPLAEVVARARTLGAELAILAVPAEAAQGVADVLARSGVKGVLNFAPVVLRLPPHVRVVNVDLTIQLEQLAFQIQTGLLPG